MTKTIFNVPTISCGHCVNTIQTEVGEMEGVSSVTASNQTKQVEVTFDSPATEKAIIALLAEINYPVAK